MKRLVALGVAKLATWIIHYLTGWVKTETPDYAAAMRRRTKEKILTEKAAAAGTETARDDIAPLAGDVYMGFATMRAAQAELANALPYLGEMSFDFDEARNQILTAIRILDENPDPK